MSDMTCLHCGATRDLIGWPLKSSYCNRIECVRVKVYGEDGVDPKPKTKTKKGGKA